MKDQIIISTVIEAPETEYSIRHKNSIKIFLAGGITNCPDWQKEFIDKHYNQVKNLLDSKDYRTRWTAVKNITFYNPRRSTFDINDPTNMEKQIVWEFEHLAKSDIIIFWFAKGSVNPIVLYELGKWGNSTRENNIIIGCDPSYERKQDVYIQTKLARPDLCVHNNLDSMLNELTRLLNCYID